MAIVSLVGWVLATPAEAVQTAHSVVVTDDPANWTPNVRDGQVNAVLQIGTKVVVGGTFTTVRRAGTSTDLTRNYIFAFDMNTGVIDPNFVPQLTGSVEALALGPDGQSVFVAGGFGSTNGSTSYRRLVRLNLSNGQIVTGFQANPSSRVYDIVARGSWLYAAGGFTSIQGVSRSGLARVNPTTGAVDPGFNLPVTGPQNGGSLAVREIDVSPDGSKLVLIGNFSSVGGQARNQVAIIDAASNPATVSSWQTDQFPFVNPANPTETWCSPTFRTFLRDIDISPDGAYFVIVTTGAYRANRLCDTASRWELGASGPGQQPTWVDWAGGDTFWGVGITGTAVYVGGHFRWMNNPYDSNAPGPGAVPREGIAALDPRNGLPLTWDPGRARGVGVFTLPATAQGLWVGNDTDRLGGEFRQRLGFFPVAGGTALPSDAPYVLPGDFYNVDRTTGQLRARSYNGNTFGSTSTVATGYADARGAFAVNGLLYTGWSDGTLRVRAFDGTTLGAVTNLDLYGLEVQPPSGFRIPGTSTRVPAFTTHLASTTGMFFENGRLYYTVAGENRLYYRYFTPESQVVGAMLHVASTGDGVAWSDVTGMTIANGNLYFARSNGNLYRVAWNGGRPTGAVTQIGGSGIDGVNWASRGIFVFNP